MRLPESDDGLEQAAQHYYCCAELLPLAGSQVAVSRLPVLFAGQPVTLLSPSYNEHRYAWQQGQAAAASAPAFINAEQVLQGPPPCAAKAKQVMLLINPCNPSAASFEPQLLLRWHRWLAEQGGTLIVDEAFIDATPERSLLAHLDPQAVFPQGLVVLRSMGKFFGLAGIRVGFLFADAPLRERLAATLEPWSISRPARVVAQAALQDRAWQQQTRRYLAAQSSALQRVIAAFSERYPQLHCVHSHFFTTLFTADPQMGAALLTLWQQCVEQGVLLRRYEHDAGIAFGVRIGLPPDLNALQRLQQTLSQCDLFAHLRHELTDR